MLRATLNQPPWRSKEGETATHRTARKAWVTSTPTRQRERTAAHSPPPPWPARSSTLNAPRSAYQLLLATSAGREKGSAAKHHHPGARGNMALFKENFTTTPTPHPALTLRAPQHGGRKQRRQIWPTRSGASSGEKRHLQAQRPTATTGDLNYGAGTSPPPLSTGNAGESSVGSGWLTSALTRLL
jgi:hypothetical protein